MRRTRWIAAAAVAALAFSMAACGGSSDKPTPVSTDAAGTGAAGTVDATPTTDVTTTEAGGGGGGGGGGSSDGFPSPADCISYDPGSLRSQYAAGVYAIVDGGGHEIVRVYGGPGELVGDQALTVAKYYRQVCFIGRGNTRENATEYVFEYWRNPSGLEPIVPASDELCSDYNRNNLTVEDMGSGDGWRVKDHDHVLQLFDNGTDAHNGELVLAHYGQLCAVASQTPSPNDYPADITFTLP